uniref:EAL domain-containing protein n=1 Tax=Heterorhabditis bacteriophora TaxID=37862 RepID=A0A1I7XA60_HETBA
MEHRNKATVGSRSSAKSRPLMFFYRSSIGFFEPGFVLALGRAEAFASALNSRLSFGRGVGIILDASGAFGT